MSTADKLNALILTKADIKLALIDKGLNPTDEFATYADDIRAIETGSSGGGVFDFAAIGYTGNEEPFKSGIEYAKRIKQDFDNGKIPTDYQNDKNLFFFPKVTFGNINLNRYFKESSLIHFPSISFKEGETFSLQSSFYGCKNLLRVDQLDYSKLYNMDFCFRDCNNLLNVGIIDCSNINLLKGVVYGTAINYNPFINTENVTNMDGLFLGCINLDDPDLSTMNTSNTITLGNMFNGCKKLNKIDLSNLDTSKVTTAAYMFISCSALETIILPDDFCINATNFNSIFKECGNLQVLPKLNTENAKDIAYIVEQCHNLRRIELISAKSLTNMAYNYLFGFSDLTLLRYMLCKDIGTQPAVTTVQFTYYSLANWGVSNSEVEDAKQSLTDSLITYSFDRASAGYSTCTLKLSAGTKSVLTEDEIALITAKGYTIA